MKGIEGALWDYGGTIDSRGEHWSHVIEGAYAGAGINLDNTVFRNAYIYGERQLNAEKAVAESDTFYHVMLKKIGLQMRWLVGHNEIASCDGRLIEKIARSCYMSARDCVMEAKPWLEKLHCRMPMVLVSNFYGNLRCVIEDMGIAHCFDSVVESARVGVSKPDRRIYALGIELLGIEPRQTVVVGDSFGKDIAPAIELGCHTIWLKGTQWDSTLTQAQLQYTGPIVNSVEQAVELILAEKHN